MTSLAIGLLRLQGCAEPYGTKLTPYSNHGYSEQKVESNGYLLTYTGTTRHSFEIIEQYWLMRAAELCPSGFEVANKTQSKKHDSMPTPVGSTTVNVGIWTPVVTGLVTCKS